MENFVRIKLQPTDGVVGLWLVSISIGKLVIRRDYPVHQYGRRALIKQENTFPPNTRVSWFSVGVLQYGRTSRLSSGPKITCQLTAPGECAIFWDVRTQELSTHQIACGRSKHNSFHKLSLVLNDLPRISVDSTRPWFAHALPYSVLLAQCGSETNFEN
jgi:hypothetical protein